jgi:hypothetical protein
MQYITTILNKVTYMVFPIVDDNMNMVCYSFYVQVNSSILKAILKLM